MLNRVDTNEFLNTINIIWIGAVCKILLLASVATKELTSAYFLFRQKQSKHTKKTLLFVLYRYRGNYKIR